MQTRAYTGSFAPRSPDFTATGWTTVVGSGYQSDNLLGEATLAFSLAADDGAIPLGSAVVSVDVAYTLGETALITQGALAVAPYLRYDNGLPLYAAQVAPPHAVGFANFTVNFPRDPDGFPWTRSTIFRKRDRLLLFGLRTAASELLTAQIEWTAAALVFNFNLPVPLVQTDPASIVGATSAQLNGRINPRGANGYYPVTYWFEYGLTTAYGSTSIPVPGLTGDVDLIVASPVAGLVASTAYHFRLVASTPDGVVYGGDLMFSTNAAATGRWRLDEFKLAASGLFTAGDRTRITSYGFDRPSTSADDASCPFLEF